MANLNVTHRELYRDIRLYLLSVLTTAKPEQVVQVGQNNTPLPANAVTMQLFGMRNFDEGVTTQNDDQTADIQNSVEVRLQLDFYGPEAESRGRIVCNLWKTWHACEGLKVCQPLYVQSFQRSMIVNESKQYEDRWIADLALQYNPQVQVPSASALDAPAIIITPTGE